MKLAVSSMALGDDYLRMAQVAFPTIMSYAKRVGADFLPILSRKFPKWHPYWEKLQLTDLLRVYDRVAFFDCDMAVNPIAPNLFELVPEDHFAGWNEIASGLVRRSEMLRAVDFYGAHPSILKLDWYFNSGMMVFSKEHVGVFKVPAEVDLQSGLPEQDYFNVRVRQLGIKFFALPHVWNAFSSMFPQSEARERLMVIHYAGMMKTGQADKVLEEMHRDVENWRRL